MFDKNIPIVHFPGSEHLHYNHKYELIIKYKLILVIEESSRLSGFPK